MDRQLLPESERWCAASGQEVPVWCTDVGKYLYGKYHDTTLCHFGTVGRCNKGAGCGFAHGFEELSLFMKMRAAERPSKVKKKLRAQPNQKGVSSPHSPVQAGAGALVQLKQSSGNDARSSALRAQPNQKDMSSPHSPAQAAAEALVQLKQSSGNDASCSALRAQPNQKGVSSPHSPAQAGAGALVQLKQSSGNDASSSALRAQANQKGMSSPHSPAQAAAGALVQLKQSSGNDASSSASGSGVRGVSATCGAREPEEEASPEHAATDAGSAGASDLLEKKLLGQRMVLAVPGTPKERPQAHTIGPPLQLLDRWVQWPAVTPQALQAFLSLHASHKWMIERALIQAMPDCYED